MKKIIILTLLCISVFSYAQTESKGTAKFFQQYTTHEQFELFKKALAVLGPGLENFKDLKRSLTPNDVSLLMEGISECMRDSILPNDLSLASYEKMPYNIHKTKNLLEFNSIIYSSIDGYDAHVEAKVIVDMKTLDVISCEYTPKSLRGLIVKFTPSSYYSTRIGETVPDVTSKDFIAYIMGTLEFILPSGETIKEHIRDGWYVPMDNLIPKKK